MLTVSHAWLAELCLKAGRIDEAACALDDGLTTTESNAEKFCLPEFHRIEGELARARARDDDAEEALTQAFALAEELGSRRFGLRAATSIARM